MEQEDLAHLARECERQAEMARQDKERQDYYEQQNDETKEAMRHQLMDELVDEIDELIFMIEALRSKE